MVSVRHVHLDSSRVLDISKRRLDLSLAAMSGYGPQTACGRISSGIVRCDVTDRAVVGRGIRTSVGISQRGRTASLNLDQIQKPNNGPGAGIDPDPDSRLWCSSAAGDRSHRLSGSTPRDKGQIQINESGNRESRCRTFRDWSEGSGSSHQVTSVVHMDDFTKGGSIKGGHHNGDVTRGERKVRHTYHRPWETNQHVLSCSENSLVKSQNNEADENSDNVRINVNRAFPAYHGNGHNLHLPIKQLPHVTQEGAPLSGIEDIDPRAKLSSFGISAPWRCDPARLTDSVSGTYHQAYHVPMATSAPQVYAARPPLSVSGRTVSDGYVSQYSVAMKTESQNKTRERSRDSTSASSDESDSTEPEKRFISSLPYKLPSFDVKPMADIVRDKINPLLIASPATCNIQRLGAMEAHKVPPYEATKSALDDGRYMETTSGLAYLSGKCHRPQADNGVIPTTVPRLSDLPGESYKVFSKPISATPFKMEVSPSVNSSREHSSRLGHGYTELAEISSTRGGFHHFITDQYAVRYQADGTSLPCGDRSTVLSTPCGRQNGADSPSAIRSRYVGASVATGSVTRHTYNTKAPSIDHETGSDVIYPPVNHDSQSEFSKRLFATGSISRLRKYHFSTDRLVADDARKPARASRTILHEVRTRGRQGYDSPEPEDNDGDAVCREAWPAWVYCTRYSDRPTAGPRVRQKRRGTGRDRAPKRERTAYTTAQLRHLAEEFTRDPYLGEGRRQQLARDLGLAQAQVKIWFQNKRAKLKKTRFMDPSI